MFVRFSCVCPFVDLWFFILRMESPFVLANKYQRTNCKKTAGKFKFSELFDESKYNYCDCSNSIEKPQKFSPFVTFS